MSIRLTENAVDQMSRYLDKRGSGVGVRLGVRSSGCSGMAYTVEFADTVNEADVVFEDQGIRLVVDPKHLLYLDGSELDFVREGLNEGFKFNNPNMKAECGCGESFTI